MVLLYAELSVLADAFPAPFDGIDIVAGSVSVRLPKNTSSKRITDIVRDLAHSK